MGLAEDSVTCYYVGANNPKLRAISLHTLHEYGDPDGVHWQGPPWLVRLKSVGVALGVKLRPTASVPADKALPWRSIFSGPDDGPLLQAFRLDPLRVRRFAVRAGGIDDPTHAGTGAAGSLPDAGSGDRVGTEQPLAVRNECALLSTARRTKGVGHAGGRGPRGVHPCLF